MTDHLLVERRDSVATVVLNRPESHNASNAPTPADGNVDRIVSGCT